MSLGFKRLGFKRLNIDDEYVEVWCVPSATHMPYVFRGQVKVLESVCLLPYVVAQIVQYLRCDC